LRNLADTLFLIEDYENATNYYKLLAKELTVNKIKWGDIYLE